MPDQPPPRRRFQFRLRTLRVVLGLIVMQCGMSLYSFGLFESLGPRLQVMWRALMVAGLGLAVIGALLAAKRPRKNPDGSL